MNDNNTELQRINTDAGFDYIEIRGYQYEVEEFSALQIPQVMEVLIYGVEDFERQKAAAKIIKQVVLPSLPATIIKITKDGNYIPLLKAAEFQGLCAKVLAAFYKQILNGKQGGSYSPEEMEYVKGQLEYTEQVIKQIDNRIDQKEESQIKDKNSKEQSPSILLSSLDSPSILPESLPTDLSTEQLQQELLRRQNQGI